jgi:hypothetical protein
MSMRCSASADMFLWWPPRSVPFRRSGFVDTEAVVEAAGRPCVNATSALTQRAAEEMIRMYIIVAMCFFEGWC